jgi:hypothetical protein
MAARSSLGSDLPIGLLAAWYMALLQNRDLCCLPQPILVAMGAYGQLQVEIYPAKA